jgi:hypothetical protein
MVAALFSERVAKTPDCISGNTWRSTLRVPAVRKRSPSAGSPHRLPTPRSSRINHSSDVSRPTDEPEGTTFAEVVQPLEHPAERAGWFDGDAHHAGDGHVGDPKQSLVVGRTMSTPTLRP